jgi:dTMP kinase
MTGARRGRFWVLDGIDGCGKSTQAALLVRALEEPDAPPLHLREPGSTRAGERIREVLLDPGVELGAAAQALLFTAARRQMQDELVRPALLEGRSVVCERFHAATFAYQAVAGGLDEEALLALLRSWAGEPRPDLVILLELDPAEAARRRGDRDRFESQREDFHARVAAGFRRYAERVRESEPLAVVDARGTEEEVHQRVLAEVRRRDR